MKVLVAQARARARGGAEEYIARLTHALTNMGCMVGTVDVDGHTDPSGRLWPLSRAVPGRILWNWAQVCRALPDLATAYDRVILGFGEGPVLPRPTLTIRHAPAVFGDTPELLGHLGARPTFARTAYVRACRSWARLPRVDRSDITLANTQWTAKTTNRLCGVLTDAVLYPPVEALPETHVDRRPFRLLALGRIAPNKRLEDAIAILDALRAKGIPAELEICGRCSDRYGRELVSRIATRPDTVLTLNATEPEKRAALARASLGLHLFRGEHFGIAVAEMIQSGVLPIVYDDGGVRELVTEPGLRFRTVDEATEIALGQLLRPDQRTETVTGLQRSTALRQALDFEDRARAVLSGFLSTGVSDRVA